jgi:dTDP-4-dehydrorhamnose reductase
MEGKRMKRVAVLGGTGMAGHVVATYLEEQGHDVYIISRSAPTGKKSQPIEATDFTALEQWLRRVGPDVVINCIGILQKQADAQPHLAVLINAYLPRWMENMYRNTDTRIIHLSTDCVFSGRRGSYTEKDKPDGDTMYDRSKALGEIDNDKDLTFRMSIIGPDCNEKGTGLFHWFMGQTGEIRGYSRAIWNGITTIHLARAIDSAIQQNLTGLYQLVCKEPIDKYHLLLLFQQTFHTSNVRIVPFDGFAVDKSLVNTRTDFAFDVEPYPKQVREMYDWIHVHRSLYGERYFQA